MPSLQQHAMSILSRVDTYIPSGSSAAERRVCFTFVAPLQEHDNAPAKRRRVEHPPSVDDAPDCLHPGLINGLCIRCGALVENEEAGPEAAASQSADRNRTSIKHLGTKALKVRYDAT
jgi:hypothetical protein